MALTIDDWRNWRAHIDRTVSELGIWVGLLNEEFEPVCDIPVGEDLTAPRVKNATADFEVSFPSLDDAGFANAALDYLIEAGFGEQDETSRLVTRGEHTWFIAVQLPGGERSRFVYKVVLTPASFEGFSAVATKPKATDVLVMLDQWPCPSVPAIWGHEPIKEWNEDAAGKYAKPLRYAPIEMATVANGYTSKGAATSTIRKIIQDSLDAGNRVMGVDVPHMVVDFADDGAVSPEVLIRRDDRTIWATIEQPAKLANVQVIVGVWWPGDESLLVDFEVKGVRKKAWPDDTAVLKVEVVQR